MPELPEVETVTRQLNQALRGQVLKEIEVRREKSFRGGAEMARAKKIGWVKRRGKMIIIGLGSKRAKMGPNFKPTSVMIVHLKLTGQLIYEKSGLGERVVGGHPTSDWVGQLPSRYTRVIIFFNDGSRLYFNDLRVFGWVRVVPWGREVAALLSGKAFDSKDYKSSLGIVGKLAPEPFSSFFTPEYLRRVLSRSSREVKLVILDQSKIVGLGNIYANDALWYSRIDPRKPAEEVAKERIQTSSLYRNILRSLREGIKAGGASYSTFVDVSGLGGNYQDNFKVYAREGEKCRRKNCTGIIQKFRLGGRGTYWCPKCQV